MAKFINKKEQVFDLKLTSYGHYLLSVGTFKPVYYAFYDDNVLYDKRYAHSGAAENQNNVHNRIKNETQYIESLVMFRDAEESLKENSDDSTEWYNEINITPRMTIPAADIFKYDGAIGDAHLDGQTNHAPAWKVVALQSSITSSTFKDEANNSQIPQIDIVSTYLKRPTENTFQFDPGSMRSMNNRTSVFYDDKVIELVSDDPLYYIDEVNTATLTKNFDIEVYLVVTSSVSGAQQQLERKYFRKTIPQVQNGYLVTPQPKSAPDAYLTTGSVEYYFDVLLDTAVDQQLVCKTAADFNKESYYVDIDFDCQQDSEESVFYDIYGSVTEPEVCHE
jgi:hypothetical protein